MKRLRKKYVGQEPHQVKTIRYLHCGEYGDQTGRPHYHACLFGFNFPDLVDLHNRYSSDNDHDILDVLNDVKTETKLQTSEILTKLWGKGHCTVGTLNYQTAAYTAGYVTKKMLQPETELLDNETGELTDIQKSYRTMSTRPGLGRGWFEKYGSDCYPSDYILHNGTKMQPPKYYEQILETQDPDALKRVKQQRIKHMHLNKEEHTTQRLMQKQKVKTSQLQSMKGKL